MVETLPAGLNSHMADAVSWNNPEILSLEIASHFSPMLENFETRIYLHLKFAGRVDYGLRT